jgi:hypothetical protein
MADVKGRATERPWRSFYDDNGFYYITADGAPSPYIAATGNEGDQAEADAELIVRAVNSHDSLVKALEEARQKLGLIVGHLGAASIQRSPNDDAIIANHIDDALKLATAARAALASLNPGGGNG